MLVLAMNHRVHAISTVLYEGALVDRYDGRLTHRVLFGDFGTGFVRAVLVDELGRVREHGHVGHLARTHPAVVAMRPRAVTCTSTSRHQGSGRPSAQRRVTGPCPTDCTCDARVRTSTSTETSSSRPLIEPWQPPHIALNRPRGKDWRARSPG